MLVAGHGDLYDAAAGGGGHGLFRQLLLRLLDLLLQFLQLPIMPIGFCIFGLLKPFAMLYLQKLGE